MNIVLPFIGKPNKWFWAGLSYFLVQLIYFPISQLVFTREDARWTVGYIIFLGAPLIAVPLAFATKTRQFGLGMVVACVFDWVILFAFILYVLIFARDL